MPRCDGLPEGPCPGKKNDDTVRLGEGDLMLCKSCDKVRFERWVNSKSADNVVSNPAENSQSNRAKKAKGKSQKDNDISGDTAAVATRSSEAVTKKGSVRTGSAGSTTADDQPIDTVTPTTSTAVTDTVFGNELNVVCNELLAYVQFYRDRSTFENVKKVAVHFYAPNEISAAKKELVRVAGSSVASLDFASDRRSSVQRSASEAEVDDILHLFEAMDNIGLLQKVKFAALSLDRLPKYAPEDTNMCTVVDRQTRTEATVEDLSTRVESLCGDVGKLSHVMAVASPDHEFDKLSQAIQMKLDSFEEMLRKFTLHTVPNAEHSEASGRLRSMRSKPEPDRSSNIVLFGVQENKDQTVWRSEIAKVLSILSGRTIQIADAIRLGGRFSPDKTRPVLVKLQSVWDRRLILASARQLASIDEFKHVFIKPDQSLPERRLADLTRLKNKANRDGKETNVINGSLFVDGICVFTTSGGYVKRQGTGIAVSADVQ